jgi:prepilin peptidase CpaA
VSALVAAPLPVCLATAAVWDLRARRVPNWLAVGGAFAGLAINVAIGHERGAVTSLTGWALGLALLLIPDLPGAIGGGDVKLLGTAGAWGGPSHVFATLFFGALVGGMAALVILIQTRRFGHLPIDRTAPEDVQGSGSRSRAATTRRAVAYAPAIAVGGLIASVVV